MSNPTLFDHYPFPPTSGQIAHLAVPAGYRLTSEDAERMAAMLKSLAAEDRAATVRLYGEERVAELEKEANRG